MQRAIVLLFLILLLVPGCGSQFQSIVGTWKVQGKKGMTVVINNDGLKVLSEGETLLTFHHDKEAAWNAFATEKLYAGKQGNGNGRAGR